MEQHKIDRINELAQKAKTDGLTEHEIAERERLRHEYIASVRQNITVQLDNTYIIKPDGTKKKLRRD